MSLIGELRAAGKLLGKLYLLDDGRRVVELVCRGRGCERWCYFNAQTGEPVQLDRLSSV